MKIVITETQLKKIILEQSKNYPIFNNTNQIATGKEKVMVDNINKWLNWMVNKNVSFEEKHAKELEVLNYFDTKCTIFDQALEDVGLNNLFTNASNWYNSVIMQSEMEDIQYKIGVKYFSLEKNNKISNITLG